MKKVAATFFFLLLFWPRPAGADSLSVQARFDQDSKSFLGIHLYESRVIGTRSVVGPPNLVFGVELVLTNTTARSFENVRLSVTALGDEFRKEVGVLGPHESKAVSFYFRKPDSRKIAVKTLTTALDCRASYEEAGVPKEIRREFPFVIRNPSLAPGALVLFAILGFLALALVFFASRLQIMRHFTTTEIVMLAILTAFYVASSLFAQILRAMAVPVIFLHSFWAVYFFILLIVTVRLVPKVGAVATMKLAGTLLSSLMFYGLDFINILTYTVPAILVFELWFLLTGYGRTLFSCVGSAVVFLVFPIGFFWFYVSPVFYHSFYALWYIGLWMFVNTVTFIPASVLGYGFANRLVKVLK